MNELKSSGSTREFSTGSHRDMAVGKGRMDLLPAESVLKAMAVSTDTEELDYVTSRDFLQEALRAAFNYMAGSTDRDYLAIAARCCIIATGMTESEAGGDSDGNRVDIGDVEACFAFGLKQVSMHYEAGAIKYGENNWRKGQPMSVLLDSGMRHTVKAIGNITDEPHCRAAAWNYLCAIWTELFLPGMFDIEARGGRKNA